MSLKSFSTSCSSRDDVGSSRMSTLHSISTARAMATICCTAMEQLDSCCVGAAGMPRELRSFFASAFILRQLVKAPLVLPIYRFSATVRFGQRVIS